MKNAMNRMEEDEALNSSSRKDYTTQNEGEAKWERTGASQKKNETKSTKPLVARRPCYALKCALIMSLCIIVRKGA